MLTATLRIGNSNTVSVTIGRDAPGTPEHPVSNPLPKYRKPMRNSRKNGQK